MIVKFKIEPIMLCNCSVQYVNECPRNYSTTDVCVCVCILAGVFPDSQS